MTTEQEQFWSGSFGPEYLERNDFTTKSFDELYRERFGITRSQMNKEFLSNLPVNSVLEVGCNIGIQLSFLSEAGYQNLHGIEIFPDAVAEAKKRLPEAHIIEGSALALPYEDSQFDLVFTSGVLIHIHPDDLPTVMREIHRVSSRYIWGLEYYAPAHQNIVYRGNENRLWKGPFAHLYQELFPDLTLVKEKRYPYQQEDNVDTMFLLEKPSS